MGGTVYDQREVVMSIRLAVLVFIGVIGGAVAAGQQPTLATAVKARPFPEYGKWWPIGNTFSSFMSDAIVSEWSALGDGDRAVVRRYVGEYVKTVYQRDARPTLVDDFMAKRFSPALQSGEFDALSYAFFRAAFESIQRPSAGASSLPADRRAFTRRVGNRFFTRVHDHLGLRLPSDLRDEASLASLKTSIAAVLAFLTKEGYFRDGAAFRFDVDVPRTSGRIVQPEISVADRLARDGRAYALFEMRYPVILPSAVYLFQTVGEAQHHSSRTIENLFDRVGLDASETSDFDPSGFPSDLVVELWQISVRRPPR